MAEKKKKASLRLTRAKGSKPKQPTQGNGKSCQHEIDIRLEYAERLLASGIRYCQVRKELVGKYQTCAKTAENYIKRVYARWREEEAEERPFKKRRATERVRETFSRALAAGDHGAAVRAAELLARMEGVAPEQVVKVLGEMTNKIELGENLEAVLEEAMNDPELRKKVMKRIAPPREDANDNNTSRPKGRRNKKDRK